MQSILQLDNFEEKCTRKLIDASVKFGRKMQYPSKISKHSSHVLHWKKHEDFFWGGGQIYFHIETCLLNILHSSAFQQDSICYYVVSISKFNPPPPIKKLGITRLITVLVFFLAYYTIAECKMLITCSGGIILERLICLFVCCFTSRSRIFHLYGDITITGEGLQNLGLCSALRAFEQGGIFIVPHLL